MGSRASTIQRVRTTSTGHYDGVDTPQEPPNFSPPQNSGENSQLFQIRPRSSSTITPAEWIRDRISFQLVVKCPICSKSVNPDDVEIHLVMCLTRPRINYNEDILPTTQGECPICLDDMEAGQRIARLPCLCIYHKACIDNWWRVNRVCPEHPDD